MCVLCGSFIKSKGHESVTLKEGYHQAENSSTEGPGPGPNDLVTAGLDAIKFIAPQSLDVTINGKYYQRSWYTDPSKELQSKITVTYGFATQSLIDKSGTRANTVLKSTGPKNAGTDSSNHNRKEFTADQKASTREILAQIERHTNITFSETNRSDTDIDNANILLLSGNLTETVTGLASLPSYGSHNARQKSGSLIINNLEKGELKNQKDVAVPAEDYLRGGELYKTLLHEIGHTLGFKHPHDNVKSGSPAKITDIPKDGSILEVSDNLISSSNTVMSYCGLSINRSINPETQKIFIRFAKEFQILDILALQSIYGNGNGVGSNSEHALEGAWEEDKDNGGLQTVVSDSGGANDTILGHSSRPNRIDLREGYYSDIGFGHDLWLGNAEKNIWVLNPELKDPNDDFKTLYTITERFYKGEQNAIIAYNSVIENAKSGSLADELSGNEVQNLLEGLGGNDILIGRGDGDELKGGDGNDTLASDGNAILNGGSGKDTASFASHQKGLTLSLADGTAWIGTRLTADAKNYSLEGIEGAVGTKYDDNIKGDQSDNVLVGGLGSDVISGGAGNDTLDGGADDIGASWKIKSITSASISADEIKQYGDFTIRRGINRPEYLGVKNKDGDEVFLYPLVSSSQIMPSLVSDASSGQFRQKLPTPKAITITNNIIASSIVRTSADDFSSNLPTSWKEASGFVSIFRYNQAKDTWYQEATIFDKKTTSNDKFGTSLAITAINGKDYIAVGAADADRVYLYTYADKKGWLLEQIIDKPVNGKIGFGTLLAFQSDGSLEITATNGKQYNFQFNEWSSKFNTNNENDPNNDTSSNKLFGEEGDDTLINRQGAELFDGGTGTDSVIFYGNRTDYTIVKSNNRILVTKDDDVNRLYSIEELVFLDEQITAASIEANSDTSPLFIVRNSDPVVNGITFDSSKKGYAYALAVKQGETTPSLEKIRQKGIEAEIKTPYTPISFIFDDLEHGASYTIHVVVESTVANQEFFTIPLQASEPKLIDPTVTSANDATHHVKFMLNTPAIVHYAYYLSGVYPSGVYPSVDEIKQGTHAETHGLQWVEEADKEQNIFLAKFGEGKLYIIVGDEVMNNPINIPASLQGETELLLAVAPIVGEDYLL